MYSFTDPPAGLFSYVPWWIKQGDTWQPHIPTAHNTSGKAMVVKLDAVADRTAAQALTHALVMVAREQLPALTGVDEYYWADLEGLTVITTTQVVLGTVDHIIATGSNDVLVVVDPGQKKTHLIPYTAHVIISVKLDQNTLIVDWDPDY